MDLSWIFLALFLVSVIIGVTKTFSRSMLRNVTRLVSIVISFAIVYIMQSMGIFAGAVNKIIVQFDLYSYLPPNIVLAYGFISAIISTLASLLLIVIAFTVCLLTLRIVLGCAVNVIEARARKRKSANDLSADTDKKKKKKKKTIFFESPMKIAISSLAGAVGGTLVLAVFFTPLFYVGSLAGSITHAMDDTDATDSVVYQTLEVVDRNIVAPYENSFVIDLYDTVGLSDLMIHTVSRGGKIVLSDGTVEYVDDIIKNIASHSVNALAEMTSNKSECNNVKHDLDSIVFDPVISTMLTDIAIDIIARIDVSEPAEDNIADELVYDFVTHYKNADRATVEADLHALGGVAEVLAKDKVIIRLMSDKSALNDMIKEHETLGDVIESISALSSFPPIIEDAFTLGVDLVAESFETPENDAEVYDIFIEELLSAMVKETDVKFDENTIKYYVYNVANQGKKVSSSNGIKGHSAFIAYTKHWARVQSAFANASEDKSYGYFTMEISGQLYVYDPIKSSIVIYSEENTEIYENYKNKISPVAGLINALSLRSRTTRITEDNLNTILTAYVASAKDAVSVELAKRMLLGRDEFVSHAVTTDKMLLACDFSAWDDPEVRKADSRLYVGIIIDLLEVMEVIEEIGESTTTDEALKLIDEFAIVGEAMDFMHETSCTTKLPELLVEALIKSDILQGYISPDIAFKNIEIVQNHEDQTYYNCMRTVAANLKFAISFAGGATK